MFINSQDIANKFKLGNAIGEPLRLEGGALHSMFKIKTRMGEFAIKQLNPHITKKTEFINNYERSEMIASGMSRAKIPAVCSLSIDGKHVIQIGPSFFMVYPFIDGVLLNEHLTLSHAECIGKIYAAMHHVKFHLVDADQAHYDYFEDTHWKTLIQRTNRSDLGGLLDSIIEWNQNYLAVIPVLNNELVITHRDMHSQNVLWDKLNQPHIVDWESAGLMNPMLEVIGYGLEWSGIILKQKVNVAFFKKLLNAYFTAFPIRWKTSPEQAFQGWLGHCVLAWTEFNIRRMLGEISSEHLEIEKGRAIIENKMIPCLNYIKQHYNDLIELILKGNP